MYTLDDLVRQRATDADQSPLFAFAKPQQHPIEYEYFTGKQLDRLVDGAVKSLVKSGVKPVYTDDVATLLGSSNLDYVVTLLALGRLGYATLALSPQISVASSLSLIDILTSELLVYGASFGGAVREIANAREIPLIPIRARQDYDDPAEDSDPPFVRGVINGPAETLKPIIYTHSAAVAGLPKPIRYTHKRILGEVNNVQNKTGFSTGQTYSADVLSLLWSAIWERKCLYLQDDSQPLTHGALIEALRVARPEALWTTPHELKLLAGKPDGLNALKTCRTVSSYGSRCPDELGDSLVKQGVRLEIVYGTSEATPLLFSISQPSGDLDWAYLSASPQAVPFLAWHPLGDNMVECVVLDGYPGKVTSNSQDPPRSFHTTDVFQSHPTLPDRWKFIGKMDDRINLSSGEKFFPLSVEGQIRQLPAVKEAAVFGNDKNAPGLLIFRTDSAQGLADSAFVNSIWPAVEAANAKSETFARIRKELIVVIPAGVDYPMTDKRSIKRKQLYNDFATMIDNAYANVQRASEGHIRLDILQLEEWILKTLRESFGISLPSADADFHIWGVDSLKALQLRGRIVRDLDLGGRSSTTSPMMVFQSGNARDLARYLYGLRLGSVDAQADELTKMRSLIERHSICQQRFPPDVSAPQYEAVVLTGATGSVGIHLLHRLAFCGNITRIYCPVRASSSQHATSRLLYALSYHNLVLPTRTPPKIVPLPYEIADRNFGIPPAHLSYLQTSLTHIIHCAWPTNYSIGLSSFEPHFAALNDLINLSLSVRTPQPAHLIFISSTSVAANTPAPASIMEGPVASLKHAAPTGYARSKLVAERILESAVESAGVKASILRVGQIVPPKEGGQRLWNPSESIPLLIRSSLATGKLPKELKSGDECSWLPVDTLAEAITEIANLDANEEMVGTPYTSLPAYVYASSGMNAEFSQALPPRLVYNIVHPQPFSWKNDFVPALQGAGLRFDAVPWDAWIKDLEAKELDPEKEPSVRLLEYWRTTGGVERGEKKTLGGGGGGAGAWGLSKKIAVNGTARSGAGLAFDGTTAVKESLSLRQAEAVLAPVGLEAGVVGYVRELVLAWRRVWEPPGDEGIAQGVEGVKLEG